jgi:hypothetical protein
MNKEKPIVDTPKDREKLEETVKAAEHLIALLKQFRVPISNNTIRAVDKARKYLQETKSTKKTFSS